MPKFMFLQYVDEATAPKPGSAAQTAEIAAYGKLLGEAQAANIMRGGDACQSSKAVFHVDRKSVV